MFSRFMVNNLVVAYRRSHLWLFLKAPFDASNFEQWSNQKMILGGLEKLLMNGDLQFFTDEYLVEFKARYVYQ